MLDYQEVLNQATQLSLDDRLRLIDALANTVQAEQPHCLSPEWTAEINRRSDELDAGSVKTEDWETIRERLFVQYGIRDAH